MTHATTFRRTVFPEEEDAEGGRNRAENAIVAIAEQRFCSGDVKRKGTPLVLPFRAFPLEMHVLMSELRDLLGKRINRRDARDAITRTRAAMPTRRPVSLGPLAPLPFDPYSPVCRRQRRKLHRATRRDCIPGMNKKNAIYTFINVINVRHVQRESLRDARSLLFIERS